MRLQIRNALVQYGAETILDHIDFEIRGNEKIAVVGRNGCGKTTLLKLISGSLTAENPNSDDASKVKDFIASYRYKTVEAKERYKENKKKAEKIYKKLSSASKDDAKKIWTNLSNKDAKIFKQFYNVSDSSGTISFTRK